VLWFHFLKTHTRTQNSYELNRTVLYDCSCLGGEESARTRVQESRTQSLIEGHPITGQSPSQGATSRTTRGNKAGSVQSLLHGVPAPLEEAVLPAAVQGRPLHFCTCTLTPSQDVAFTTLARLSLDSR
jgi:hypothetical protein